MPMKLPPSISIVVPTYKRPAPLYRLLQSLTRLKYPTTRFEVILVDDGGVLSFEPIWERFGRTFNIVGLSQSNSGPAAARNSGAGRSEGAILAFIDDDCEADPLWLTALSKGFEADRGHVCGGRTMNALPHNPYATASQLLIDYLYQHYNPELRLGAFFPTNNFAVPRVSFLELGGFDPGLRFGEDREFCHRWARAGYGFRSVPGALVYHHQYLDFPSFVRLHFNYGRGTFFYRRKTVESGSKPGSLSPPSFYAGLMLSGLRRERNARGLLHSLLLLLSQAANTAGLFSRVIKDTFSYNLGGDFENHHSGSNEH
jgi:glycosyltransferase involved in cell wall biosynthesis